MKRQTLTRRKMLTLMSAPLAVVGSGTFTEAEAQAFWNVVGDVRIGGVHFSVGVHSPYAGRYGRDRGYFYRTSHRLSYGNRRCNSSCYRRNGYAYHHESCPLLGAHIDYYGAPPAYYGLRDWRRGDRYRYDGYGYSDRDRGRGRRYRYDRGRGRGRRRGRGRGNGRW